jgi:hypothetical protein
MLNCSEPSRNFKTLKCFDFVPSNNSNNITGANSNLKRRTDIVLDNEPLQKKTKLSEEEHINCPRSCSNNLNFKNKINTTNNNNNNNCDNISSPKKENENSSLRSTNVHTAQKMLQELQNLHYVKVSPNEVEKSDVILGHGNFATVSCILFESLLRSSFQEIINSL